LVDLSIDSKFQQRRKRGTYVIVIIIRCRRGNAQTSATQPISIGSTQGITVTAPAGGETLHQGQQFTIQWSATDSPQTVNISLLSNGNHLYQIASNVPNTGSSLWTIPEDNNYGPGFEIQISEPGYAPATSNAFSITATRG